MRQTRSALLAAALFAVSACGRMGDDPYVEALPDVEGLALEITGAVSEGAALSSTQQALEGTVPEYLQNARQAVAYLNGEIKRVITPIAELAAANAGKAQPGDVRMYGPKDRGNFTFRLYIKKLTETRFGWRLEAKPLGGADDQYVRVAGGALTKGELPHRGRGMIGIDLDALKTLDSTFVGQGKLFCGFAHVGDTKTLIYRLAGFTPDLSKHDPVNAIFTGHRLMPSRATRVRLAGNFDVVKTTDAKELVRSRVRYIPGVGGRADILATEGDVPAGKVYLGSACWDAQESEGFAVLRVCDQGAPDTCTVVETRGALVNCKPGLESPEPPPADPNNGTLEPESPVDGLEPPVDFPDGDGA